MLDLNSIKDSVIKFVVDNKDLLTILILGVTAYEAFKAQKATSESNDLNLLPLIAIYFRGEASQNPQLIVKNLGQGTAFDIEIEDWDFIFTDIQEIYRLSLWVKGTNVLGKDEEITLESKCISKKEKTESKTMKEILIFTLYPDSGTEHVVKLTIKFKDARGNRYFTKIQTGAGGLRIIKSPKKLDILNIAKLNLESKIKYLLIYGRVRVTWLFKKPHLDWNPKKKRKYG